MRRIVLFICTALYLAVLVRLIIFKFPPSMTHSILSTWSPDRLSLAGMNLIPFNNIFHDLFTPILPTQRRVLFYNVLAFVPWGGLLLLIWQGIRLRRVALAGLILSLLIEAVQVITGLGTGDIDDVILNVTGCVMGYAGGRLVQHYTSKASRRA